MSCGMGCSGSAFIDPLDLRLGVHPTHQILLRCLNQEPSSQWWDTPLWQLGPWMVWMACWASLSSLAEWETSGNNTPNLGGSIKHDRLNGMNLSLNTYHSFARNGKDADVSGQCQRCCFCGLQSLCVTEAWPIAQMFLRTFCHFVWW